ncbi:MAG: aspartate aminotransferase family protein [Chromatiales bacterium]|nr:aspartate aminotransferase family protein [Chromatiales bacterium]
MSNAMFPESGLEWPEIEKALHSFRDADVDWRHGRAPMYIFWASEEVLEVTKKAYMEYFSENALGARAFPSLVRMEAEVVRMAAEILGGDESVRGNMTSGGTESIFLAVKTARDYRRATRPVRGTPNLVVPYSGHPAYYKAAHYMDLEVRPVPTRDDFRADVDAMADAIDDDTIFVLGSAPSFSLGVFDPIEDLGRLARERDLWLHVDACVGGFIAPHVRALGYPVPAYDFSVPGVTSISADLHKLGFAAKPASTILYRDEAHYRHQGYEFDAWPRGVYKVPTFTGTRPGGAIAAAWSVLKFLGAAGYRELARQIMDVRARLQAGIRAIPELELIGDPEIGLFCYGSPSLDIRSVAEAMSRRGWLPGINADPPAIHLFLVPLHAVMVDDYLADLGVAVEEVRSGRVAAKPAALVY